MKKIKAVNFWTAKTYLNAFVQNASSIAPICITKLFMAFNHLILFERFLQSISFSKSLLKLIIITHQNFKFSYNKSVQKTVKIIQQLTKERDSASTIAQTLSLDSDSEEIKKPLLLFFSLLHHLMKIGQN